MISFHIVDFKPPEGVNIIAGTSHFIKTVEDLYEALVTSSPYIKFGIAFCEASGPTLIRKDGNDQDLIKLAVELAEKISAGHFFVIAIKNAYPINVLDRIKHVQEIVNIYTASANPLQFLIAETDQGRTVIGVVDGFKSKGVEGEKEEKERHELLRKFGYKR
jgi:hypothetical protein